MGTWKDPISMIQEAASKGEPVFVLRGQDICATPAIWAYIEDCKAKGASREHIGTVELILKEFQSHINKHLKKVDGAECKVPD